MNKRITLHQTVVDPEDFYELLEIGILPLAISLSETDKRIYMDKNKNKEMLSIASLYTLKDWWKNHENQTYAFIKNEKLKELVESKKIYIPEFIDLNGTTKYVDYIKADPQLYNTNFGNRLIFRDKKRIFEKRQAAYSIKRNNPKGTNSTLPFTNKNSNYEIGEIIDILCVQAIKQHEEIIKRAEGTKQKFKNLK